MPKNVIEDFIEVELPDDQAFLKIKETLTRIGIPSKKEKKLYQTAHIFHKRGKYYIVHFKQMFELEGKPTTITEDDLARRNTIIDLLEEWQLLKVISPEDKWNDMIPLSDLKIITHKEKSEWVLEPKFTIGKK